MKRLVLSLALAAPMALTLDACMPRIRITNAFSSRFADNERPKITQIIARLPADSEARPTNSLGRPLLVGVSQGEARTVVLYDLTTRQALWTAPVHASSTPEIEGDAVVVEVGTHTQILDLATGRSRGRVEHIGLDCTGSARDGDTIVLTFATGLVGSGSRRSGRVVAVDASSASIRWEHEISGILGRPTAAGGAAFVPWDRQSIAVLDLSNGHEIARLRSTDDVLSWVFHGAGGVYYGGRGIYRLTPDSATGTRAGSAFLANPLDGVPGDPQVHADAFHATTGVRTAREKILFGFRPIAGEPGRVTLQDGALYLAYYHDLVAVDAATGAVRWAQRIEDDIEALQVTSRGVFVASGNGKLRGFEAATGAMSVVAELGAQVGAIHLDAEGLEVPAGGAAPEGSVREQLVAMVRDADNRLVPFRSFLVGVLARREEPEVTRDLLDLYTQRSIPGQLRQSVATAIQGRRAGAPFLVAALAEHYDYLEGRQAPPLQVIAPALVGMSARDSVPGLLSHLLDQDTPAAALPDVINAIATLGEGSVVPTLRSWVQLYKSDSTFHGNNSAPLAAAVEAIFHHGDAGAREWLRALTQDATANVAIRTRFEELTNRESVAATQRQTRETQDQAQASLQAELNRLHEAQSTVPATLTDALFDEVWNAHLDEIRECAQGAVSRQPSLNQIRVVVTLRSAIDAALLRENPPAQSGGPDAAQRHATTSDEAIAWTHSTMETLAGLRARVRLTTYAPNDAQLRTCMDQILTPLEFQAFRATRQEFRRVIDTRAARGPEGAGEAFSGLGVNGAGVELPWWLVSAPTLEVVNPAPRAPAVQPGATATRPTPGATVPQQGTTRPQQGTTPPPPATPTRPWWEE